MYKMIAKTGSEKKGGEHHEVYRIIIERRKTSVLIKVYRAYVLGESLLVTF
jgi:hypothetical protein